MYMNVKQKRKQNGRRVKPAHSTDWKMKRQAVSSPGPEMLHQWRGQLFCPEDHEGDLICLAAIVLNESGMNHWCW